MFERFTVEARDTLVRAQDEARALRHRSLGTEHLLLALLAPQAGTVFAVLDAAGVRAAAVRSDVLSLAGPPSTLISQDDAEALRTIGIDADAVLSRMVESFGAEALSPPCRPRGRGSRRGVHPGWMGFSARSKKVIELALREAVRRHHDHIGNEHLLLGLLREGNGLAAQVLTRAGLDLDALYQATLAAMDEAA